MDIALFTGGDGRCMDLLIQEGHRVVGLVAEARRNRHLLNLLRRAFKHAVPALRPQDLEDPDTIRTVASWKPDAIFVLNFSRLLSAALLDIPSIGSFNFHFGLLPDYRGPAPHFWTLACGDREAGVTVHWIDEGICTGDIVMARRFPISPHDTGGILRRRLDDLSLEVMKRFLLMLGEGPGEIPRTPQAEGSDFKGAPRVRDVDLIIDWRDPARKIVDLVRAANPDMGARTYLLWRCLFVWEVEGLPHEEAPDGTPPGRVFAMADGGPLVKAGDGCIRLQVVQREGEYLLSGTKLAHVAGMKVGDRLGQWSY